MWASLSVRFGGLGVHSAVELAPLAFLSSVSGSSELILHCAPNTSFLHYPEEEAALSVWTQGHKSITTFSSSFLFSKSLGHPWFGCNSEFLVDNAADERSKVHLLSSTSKESGVWLNAVPVSALGLWMDDETIYVAVCLRLSAPLRYPHQYCHCGEDVNSLATHRLSCWWSEGHLVLHAATLLMILSIAH